MRYRRIAVLPRAFLPNQFVNASSRGPTLLPRYVPIVECSKRLERCTKSMREYEEKLLFQQATLRGIDQLTEMIQRRSIEVLPEFGRSVSGAAEHLQKIFGEIHRLETTIASMQAANHSQDNKDTKQDLERAKQDLKDVEQRLERAKQDLKDTKQDLERANQDVERTKQDLERRYDELLRHRPWFLKNLSDENNPSRCFAPVSGQVGLDADALEAATKEWGEDKYSFIDDVGGKVARNALKRDLLEAVVPRLIELDRAPEVGANTACIVGERGGGKSHTLKRLVAAAGKKLPNVVAVYLDYTGYGNASKPLPLPSAVVEEALALRGVKLNSVLHDMKDVQQTLRELNLRLLLVVDELEEAYRISDSTLNKERLTSFNALLQELNDIGNSPTGEIVAYVCGSTTSLPSLISAQKQDAALCERFAMLEAYAVDLNGSKYPGISLPSTWLTSESDFKEVLSALHPGSGETLHAHARSLALIYGCNLRTLNKFRADAKGRLKFDWCVRALDVKQKYESIMVPLDQKLKEINTPLLEELKTALRTGIGFNDIDVFTLMKGLTPTEVREVLGHNMQAVRDVDVLCERSCYIGGGHNTLYPISALSLLVETETQMKDASLAWARGIVKSSAPVAQAKFTELFTEAVYNKSATEVQRLLSGIFGV